MNVSTHDHLLLLIKLNKLYILFLVKNLLCLFNQVPQVFLGKLVLLEKKILNDFNLLQVHLMLSFNYRTLVAIRHA
jgi:hypothetical protein